MRSTGPASSASVALGWGCIAFLFTNPCLAGAGWFTENGGADMAMAAAGRAALAIDATTLAANPAGMTALTGRSFVVAVLPVSLEARFEGRDGTVGSAENRAGVALAGSLFAVHTNRRLSLGLGVHSYLGLGFDFGDQWIGSRTIERGELQTVNLSGAAGCRVTDRLSVGAALAAQYAGISAATGVNNDASLYRLPAGLPDGSLRISGTDWAPAGTLGLTFQVDQDTRVGMAWTSPVRHAMNLDIHASNLHPVLASSLALAGEPRFEMNLPQQVVVSAVRRIAPGTDLSGSVGWQDWSSFGETHMVFGGAHARLFPTGLDDTWHVAFGLRHQLDPRWTLAAGVAYDTDPSTHGTMPPYFPVADQLRLAAGVEHRVNDTLTLRFALSVLNQGDIRVEQDGHPLLLPGVDPLRGTFDGGRVLVIGVAADYDM